MVARKYILFSLFPKTFLSPPKSFLSPPKTQITIGGQDNNWGCRDNRIGLFVCGGSLMSGQLFKGSFQTA